MRVSTPEVSFDGEATGITKRNSRKKVAGYGAGRMRRPDAPETRDRERKREQCRRGGLYCTMQTAGRPGFMYECSTFCNQSNLRGPLRLQKRRAATPGLACRIEGPGPHVEQGHSTGTGPGVLLSVGSFAPSASASASPSHFHSHPIFIPHPH